MSGIFMMALQITFVLTGFYGVNRGLEYFYDKRGGKKSGTDITKPTKFNRGE